MNAPVAWSVVAIFLAIFGGVVFLLLRADHAYVREDREAPTQVLHVVVAWNHEAPAEPFTVQAAHRVMQQHRACLREDCGRKSAAYSTLIEARRLKPDSGRTY
jgi:hypothetical protein